MSIVVESKFVVEIVYNGITKAVEVEPEEQVTALLRKAIAAFGITQNAHLLSLSLQAGWQRGAGQRVGQTRWSQTQRVPSPAPESG